MMNNIAIVLARLLVIFLITATECLIGGNVNKDFCGLSFMTEDVVAVHGCENKRQLNNMLVTRTQGVCLEESQTGTLKSYPSVV